MAGRVLQAAVAGASTLLGKELVNEISDSAASAWDLHLLEEGDEIEGQLSSAGDEALVMHSLSDEAFAGLDLVIFATPAEITQQYLEAALKAGAAVVDVSGVTYGRSGFLLRSPWLPGGPKPDLTTQGITTPHPAALMLSLVLERIGNRFGPVQAAATVLEPASAVGAAGVDELHQQTVTLLSFQEVPKKVFGGQVAFNLQTQLGEEAQTDLRAVRERIQADCRALLGSQAAAQVSVQVVQAPVFHGYFLSVHLGLGQEVQVERVRSLLAGGVVVAEEDTSPSNQAAVETGELLVKVDSDDSGSQGLWLTLAADNLRLAARNAVGAALELVALRPGTRVQ